VKEPTLIKINSVDPKEAEYIAKVLINEANKQKRPIACSKTIKRLFRYEKRVSIGR
jgi:hypothetical protein